MKMTDQELADYFTALTGVPVRVTGPGRLEATITPVEAPVVEHTLTVDFSRDALAPSWYIALYDQPATPKPETVTFHVEHAPGPDVIHGVAVAGSWRKPGGQRVQTFRFPAPITCTENTVARMSGHIEQDGSTHLNLLISDEANPE